MLTISLRLVGGNLYDIVELVSELVIGRVKLLLNLDYRRLRLGRSLALLVLKPPLSLWHS